jgi:hypothetical protein
MKSVAAASIKAYQPAANLADRRRGDALAFGGASRPAAMGEIAEEHRRRARCEAGMAQMPDRQVEIAVGVGHQPDQMHGIGLSRADREHLLAGDFCLVGVTRGAMRAGAVDRLHDVEPMRLCAGWLWHALRIDLVQSGLGLAGAAAVLLQ